MYYEDRVEKLNQKIKRTRQRIHIFSSVTDMNHPTRFMLCLRIVDLASMCTLIAC